MRVVCLLLGGDIGFACCVFAVGWRHGLCVLCVCCWVETWALRVVCLPLGGDMLFQSEGSCLLVNLLAEIGVVR